MHTCPLGHRPWYIYLLVIRERNSQRKGFPWSHGQIAGERPAGTGAIPHSVLALEWAIVACDGAVYGEAMEGANREVHRGRILVEA